MQTKIILLSGKQGSGKTTTQHEIINQLESIPGVRAVGVNFADILYEMHNAVLNILDEYMEPRNIKKDGPLLQVLGTEWGRKTLGDNIWIELLKARIDKLTRYTQTSCVDVKLLVFVVSDCRFENEFKAFYRTDALKVRLLASEAVRKTRCSMWRENTQHQSETDLDVYSDEGLFDVYVNTESTSVEKIASHIVDRLIVHTALAPLLSLVPNKKDVVVSPGA